MKAPPLVLCCAVLFFGVATWGQDSTQLSRCKDLIAKDTTSDLSPDMCTLFVAGLPANETVETVLDDGSFATVTPDGMAHLHSLPPKVRSGLLLNEATKAVRQAEGLAKDHSNSFAAAFLPDWKGLWSRVRDEYCSLRPAETYTDLTGKEQACVNTVANSGAEEIEELAFEVTNMRSNLLNALVATGSVTPDRTESNPNEPAGAIPGSNTSKHPPLPAFEPSLVTAASDTSGHSPSVAADATCQKAISFAIARGGGLQFVLPNVSPKWLDKIQKKYTGVCFPQHRSEVGQTNYLVVLSTSSSVFNGLEPVYRTSTTTTPVSGSGTVNDNYVSTWNYTYDGTVTSTTTTEANVAYADTTTVFYANAYNESGALVGASERSTSVREGGDPSNAAGYNIASALMSIHLKEHLVESIIKQVRDTR